MIEESIPLTMDPDADPGGPKTCGFCGSGSRFESGSATLALTCGDVRLWCTGTYQIVLWPSHTKSQHVSITLHMKLYIPEIYLSVFIYSMNLKQKLSPIQLYCFHMKGYCLLQYNCIINISNLLAVCVCCEGWVYHCAAKISHPRFAA